MQQQPGPGGNPNNPNAWSASNYSKPVQPSNSSLSSSLPPQPGPPGGGGGNMYDCYKTSASPGSSPMPPQRHNKGYDRILPPPPGFQGRPHSSAYSQQQQQDVSTSTRLGPPRHTPPPPQSQQQPYPPPHMWTQMGDGRVMNALMFPQVMPQPMFMEPPYASPGQGNPGHYYYNPTPPPPMLGPPFYYDPYGGNANANTKSPNNPSMPPPSSPDSSGNYYQIINKGEAGKRGGGISLTKEEMKKERKEKALRLKEGKSSSAIGQAEKVPEITEMRSIAQSLMPSNSSDSNNTAGAPGAAGEDENLKIDKICEMMSLMLSVASSKPMTNNEQVMMKLTEELNNKDKREEEEEFDMKLSLEEGRAIWAKPLREFKIDFGSSCKFKDDTDNVDDLLCLLGGPHAELVEEVQKLKGEKEEKEGWGRNEIGEGSKAAGDEGGQGKSVNIPRKGPVMMATSGDYEFTEMTRYRGLAYQKNPESPSSATGRDPLQSTGGSNVNNEPSRSLNYTSTGTGGGGSWQPALGAGQKKDH